MAEWFWSSFQHTAIHNAFLVDYDFIRTSSVDIEENWRNRKPCMTPVDDLALDVIGDSAIQMW